MQTSRRRSAYLATLIALATAFGAACSGSPFGQSAAGPTAAPAAPPPLPSPTAESTSVAVRSAPAPTPDPKQQAFGLHSPLPLAGEYAVTANSDDRTLSVVQIGAAAVATTVQLDLAPHTVGAVPNSDTVFVADGSEASHAVAVASLNSSSESGTVDIGTASEEVAAPAPTSTGGPIVVLSDTDDTIRSLDPASHALGNALKLGAGPHSVAVAAGNSMC